METKFTKGDWKVGESITSVECDNDYVVTCHHITEQWITEEQAVANAQLISAAPDLLEVALKCLEWCNGCQSVEFVNGLRIQSENAIRKAVGSDFLA